MIQPTVMSDSTKPSSKPWCLWILQLVIVVQLVVAIVRIANSWVVVRSQPFHLPWAWVAETLAVVAVTVVLLLALQRWLRGSAVVAPAAGAVWWLLGLGRAIQSIGAPAPPDLNGVLFENVPTASEVLGVVLVHGLLLTLVGSLFLHRATRAYLAGAPTAKASSSEPL